MNTEQAPHRGNDEPKGYEIYLDLHQEEPDSDAPTKHQAELSVVSEVVVIHARSIPPVEDDTGIQPPDGHWGLTDALISRGADDLNTALPRPSITDRPNRLRRRPGLWARRRRTGF